MSKHLYSLTKPFKTTWIEVDSRHRLKIKEYGNPQGIPVIFFHGGPGSQTN
jgi:proline iminopeptidase